MLCVVGQLSLAVDLFFVRREIFWIEISKNEPISGDNCKDCQMLVGNSEINFMHSTSTFYTAFPLSDESRLYAMLFVVAFYSVSDYG